MNAHLRVVAGIAVPSILELRDGQTIRLGRSHDNEIVVHDDRASRVHAKLYVDSGHWYIGEIRATNGTLVNGKRITGPTRLAHGHKIGIGGVRFQFSIATHASTTATMPAVEVVAQRPLLDELTTFQLDELTALLQFMNGALDQATPYGLISLALAAIQNQTGANVCGFVGVGTEEALPRITLPAEASFDVQLSRRLTGSAPQSPRAVWIGAGEKSDQEPDGDSLSAYDDAIGIALRATGPSDDPSEASKSAFGVLHVYRSDRLFTEQEVRFCEVLSVSLANYLRLLRAHRVLVADNSRLRRAQGAPPRGQEMIGNSKTIRALREHVAKLCDAKASVLILGESGVGKELVAEALHYWSQRSEGPLVSVNCATIPTELAESALFGHRKGAFTGALTSHVGYFQEADDGTLFLDEVGELSLKHQKQLLRVLETKKIRPVGATADIQIDVRVIAATNRDLQNEVKQGTFREDLLYRLDNFHILVPPLRDRREDIPMLARHFLDRANEECHYHATLTEAALQRLVAAPWPGNVRQLRSVIETAVSITSGGPIDACDLDSRIRDDEKRHKALATESLNLEDHEKALIREALARTHWNVTHAADLLGIHRDTLANKIKKYQISRAE